MAALPLTAETLSAPAPDDRHIPALDGLRGLAIALVLVFHLGLVYNFDLANLTWRTGFFLSAWCGVDLFFVLSGFLITGILDDARGRRHYFRNFYLRRALRIFPLYYGVLAYLFFVHPLLFTVDDEYRRLADMQLWLWAYVQNFWVVLHQAWVPFRANHFWSLAIEEQFYLVWPFVVFACQRTTLLRIAFGLIVGALTLRIAMTAYHLPPQVIYLFTACRLDGFAAGAVVALLLRGGIDRATFVRTGGIVAGVIGLLLAGIAVAESGLRWNGLLSQTVGMTLLAIFFAAVVAVTAASPPKSLLPRLLAVAPLRWLGRYSYGIYVYHFLLASYFIWLIRPDRFPESWQTFLAPRFYLVFLAGASAISILLAVLSYHLIEKPFLNLKRFFPTDAAQPTSLPEPVRKQAA